MKTDKIPSRLSVDELYEILSKKYDGVKKNGNSVFVPNYSNTKIYINKGSDGYVVKAGMSFSLIVVMGVVCGIMVVVTTGLGLIPQFIITMFVVAIVGFLLDMLYNKHKKNLLQEFCNSINMESTKHDF